MLSAIAKPLLVSTSLSPVLIAYGINAYSDGKDAWDYLRWFGAAILLVCLCLMIMQFAKTKLERQHLRFRSIKCSDKEVMTFLLAYLLPLIPAKTIGISGHTLTGIFVFVMFFLAIYHSNAFNFNPLLGLLGYNFYEVQSEDGMSYLLITRMHLLKSEQVAEVVQLFPYTFLNVGSST